MLTCEGKKVSQERIMEFLKKQSPEKFTAREMHLLLGIGRSIYPNLRKLKKEADRLKAIGLNSPFKYDLLITRNSLGKETMAKIYWYEDGS